MKNVKNDTKLGEGNAQPILDEIRFFSGNVHSEYSKMENVKNGTKFGEWGGGMRFGLLTQILFRLPVFDVRIHDTNFAF